MLEQDFKGTLNGARIEGSGSFKKSLSLASIPATTGTETINITFSTVGEIWYYGKIRIIGHASAGVPSRVGAAEFRFLGYITSDTLGGGATSIVVQEGHEITASIALTQAALGSANKLVLTLSNTYGDVYNDSIAEIDIISSGGYVTAIET